MVFLRSQNQFPHKQLYVYTLPFIPPSIFPFLSLQWNYPQLFWTSTCRYPPQTPQYTRNARYTHPHTPGIRHFPWWFYRLSHLSFLSSLLPLRQRCCFLLWFSFFSASSPICFTHSHPLHHSSPPDTVTLSFTSLRNTSWIQLSSHLLFFRKPHHWGFTHTLSLSTASSQPWSNSLIYTHFLLYVSRFLSFL